ncbi:hypothetical protein CHS0354_020006 [Potamilus streckersoni]|uniref:Uncharacterized protein n=1 Tax=Potamilus streckersoni TaxID=2493646 RepID=A0AAE0SYB5_9BIVA|nr:hypothetical protein CHS0354_020006 [Potamilus streckersoni]
MEERHIDLFVSGLPQKLRRKSRKDRKCPKYRNIGYTARDCPNILPGDSYAAATYTSKVAEATENENSNEKEMEEIHQAVDLLLEQANEGGNQPNTSKTNSKKRKHKK